MTQIQNPIRGIPDGFQGMVPNYPGELNPNDGPADPTVAAQLGPPGGPDPIKEATDKRESLRDFRLAVTQARETAAQDGNPISLKEAARIVVTSWGLGPNPTATSPKSAPSLQSPQLDPAPPGTFQKPPVRLDSPTETHSDTTPPASPPASDSVKTPKTSTTQTSRLVAEFMREQEPDLDLPDVRISPTEASWSTSSVKEAKELVSPSKEEVDDLFKTPAPSGEYRAKVPFATALVQQVVAEMEAEVSDEVKSPVESQPLHQQTPATQRALTQRQAFRWFTQSFGHIGMPRWSRWSNADRKALQTTFDELVNDVDYVDSIVRLFDRYAVSYGAMRLCRMCSIFIGFAAWSTMETDQ